MPDASTRLEDRALIRIAGEDVRGFLQGLVTQDLAAVAPDAPQWAGLLTAQGKALFDFILWADGESVLIDCEAEQREALIRRLTLYRLRRPIAIEAVGGGVHWSLLDGQGVPDPRNAALGRRWLGAETGEEAAAAWRAHRLSLGVTEGAAELGQDKTLWLEANAAELNGVSFAKGCYVGQENTARMHYRAKVNRRLVVAPLGAPGDRTRATYPELGLMIELRRVEALGDAQVPAWLAAALAPAAPDRDAVAAFHAAIREERLDDAAARLEAEPGLLEARCGNGWSPLIVAAYAGAGPAIDWLLARGANPDAGNAKGTVPLMYAKGHYLRTGDAAPMRQLLAGGAEPHIRDAAGLTLLDYVPEDRREEVAAILAAPAI